MIGGPRRGPTDREPRPRPTGDTSLAPRSLGSPTMVMVAGWSESRWTTGCWLAPPGGLLLRIRDWASICHDGRCRHGERGRCHEDGRDDRTGSANLHGVLLSA